jgi:hypothetical protein
MSKSWTVLASFFLASAAAVPGAAQQAPVTPQRLPIEACASCFSYLEFPPLAKAEVASGQEYSRLVARSPAAAGWEDPIGEQKVGLVASSKQ